ncbi:MAG: hypothetical protein LBF97_04290, partial [Elusimicrobiota bacterium]|nr:hypothetical protein [Elusimicrobiota bacterium]
LQFAMVLSMINMTFKNNNNVVSLFQALRDTIGEKPVEKQNILLNNPPQIIIKNDVPRPNK